MSYLLTEIALEMLGYKFYDVDGNFGPTNFQNNPQLANSNFMNDEIGETESLANILNLAKTSSGDVIEENTAFNDNGLDEVSTSADVDSSTNVENIMTSSQQQEKPLEPLQNVKRTLPSALSKLLDNECERIRNQILRNKNVHVQSFTGMKTNVHQATEYLASFKEQERANLESEVQTMHTFRNLVERSLFKVRSESYAKYKRIFETSAEDTSIDIDNI